MITILNKTELRLKAKKKREEFASSNLNYKKSSFVISKILNSDEFKNAKNIAIYLPIKNEIDISSLLRVQDKNFYLPRCNNSDLEFVKYIGDDYLYNGYFDIQEPLGDNIDPNILDLIYIPALMANTRNYRLGYGKGFYDRFFNSYKIKAKKIIIVAKELIDDSFIEDKFDFQCDSIISA